MNKAIKKKATFLVALLIAAVVVLLIVWSIFGVTAILPFGLAIATMYLVVAIEYATSDGERRQENDEEDLLQDFSNRVGPSALLEAIISGVIVFVVTYLVPKLEYGWFSEVLAAVALVGAVGLTVCLISRWLDPKKGGATVLELGLFSVLAIVFCLATHSVAKVVTGIWPNKVFGSIIMTIPWIALVSAIGTFVTDFFYFRHKATKKEDTYWLLLGRLAFFLSVILLGWLLIRGVSGANFTEPTRETESGDESAITEPASGESASTEPSESPTGEVEQWYTFLNTKLQDDGDESNDFNFGPNPYNPDWTAVDYDRDFRQCLALDSALLAGDSAWADAIVGTRYLGIFYEECKGEWASTINAAKRAFMEDQILHYKTLDAFYLFLDSAESVELKQGLDMDDQMYMNPFTVDGVPDLIVMETRDHDGWFLVYTFVIKGQKFEVAYRIDCGYQPTNVEEVMDIKPQPEPERPTQAPTTEPPTTEPPTTEPPTTEPPTTEPPTTEPPTTELPTTTQPYTKDKSKGLTDPADVGPGTDETGPGTYNTESSLTPPSTEWAQPTQPETTEAETIPETRAAYEETTEAPTSADSRESEAESSASVEPPVNATEPDVPTTGPITTIPGTSWGGPPD